MSVGQINVLPKIDGKKFGWPWTVETNLDLYSSNQSWPKISIVTPSFNQGKFIEETIRSVLLQNYPNLEYIIIDGGSTDETISIIKKYEKWLSFWESKPDKGQSHAINKGIERCSGELFNWVNSDDYLESDALYNIATTYKNNTESIIIAGSARGFDDDSDRNTSRIINAAPSHKSLSENIGSYQVLQISSFFNLNHIRSFAYPINEQFHFSMDCELFLKCLLATSFRGKAVCDKIITNARSHKFSKGGRQDTLASDFLCEECTLYYALADYFDLHTEKNNLRILTKEKLDRNYKFDIALLKDIDSDSVKKGINIFFMKKFESFYGQSLLSEARLFMSLIDVACLDKKNQKIFNRISNNLIYLWPFIKLKRKFINK